MVCQSVGAASPILEEAVKRISAVLNSKEQNVALYDLYEATIRKSFVLSSDQAHALHPNYASKVSFGRRRKILFVLARESLRNAYNVTMYSLFCFLVGLNFSTRRAINLR